MFTNQLAECNQNCVILKDVHPGAVNLLLQYAYTGNITVDDTNVQDLLPTACRFGVENVKSKCCKYLLLQLHPSNCIGFSKFADAHSCPALQMKCDDFLRRHFTEVVNHQEFLELLDADDLRRILSQDGLAVSSEVDVLYAIKCWIIHDPKTRRSKLSHIISCVRLIYLPLNILHELLDNEILAPEDKDIRHMIYSNIATIREYKTKGQLRLDKNFISQHKRLLTVEPREPAKSLVVVGGKDRLFATMNSTEMYDPSIDRWQQLRCIPTARFECAAATLHGCLYVLGGLTKDLGDSGGAHCHDQTVSYWSAESDTWEQGPPLDTPRSALAVVSLEGYLYAMGGYDGDSYLRTIERYRPGDTSWQRCADMLQGRSCFCAAAVEEHLYALGGYGPPCLNRLVLADTPSPTTNNPLATMGLTSVERFDSEKDAWTMVAPMKEKRINFGAVGLCGFVFAVGGHNGVAYLSSCERYDPYTNQWTTVSGMGQPRTGLGVTVIGRHMYVVGGHSCAQYPKTIMKYEPVTDTWTQVSEMDCNRSGFAISAL